MKNERKKTDTRKKIYNLFYLSDSARFMRNYFAILLAFIIFAYIAITNMIEVRILMETSMDNFFTYPILLSIIIGLFISMKEALVTRREIVIMDGMIHYKNDINTRDATLPVFFEKFADSFCVKQFQKLATAEYRKWPESVKPELKEYLKEKLLKGPWKLSIIYTILPSLGMLGTIMGFCLIVYADAKSADLLTGFGNALGTTAIGIYSMIPFFIITQIIKSNRMDIFRTVNVLFKLQKPSQEEEVMEHGE